MPVLHGVFRIGRDAELRRIPSGEAVINLGLAYNHGQKSSDGKKPTQWVDAVLWGKRAESLAQYLVKGTQVECILGDVHIESFNKADGTPYTKLAARIQDIEFVGAAGQSRNEGSQHNSAASHAPTTPASNPKPTPSRGGGFDDMDDDIPF